MGALSLKRGESGVGAARGHVLLWLPCSVIRLFSRSTRVDAAGCVPL